VPTLRELEAQFIIYRKETEEEMMIRGTNKPSDLFTITNELNNAHGIRFICPKSFLLHNGKIGAHMIQIYFSGSPIPDSIGLNKDGKSVRWSVSGSSLDDLSLSPSILEQDSSCGWHGFIGTNGIPKGSAE
jgi:hypothetical protein